MKRTLSGLALSMVLAASVQAQEQIEERLQSTSLSFSGGRDYTNAVLTVTGPDGYEKEESVSRGLPIFRLQTAGRLVDGYYQYSLVAASDEEVEISTKVDNGRGENAPKTAKVPFTMYGAFTVSDGLLTPVTSDEGGGQDEG